MNTNCELAVEKINYLASDFDVLGYELVLDDITYLRVQSLCGHQFRILLSQLLGAGSSNDSSFVSRSTTVASPSMASSSGISM